MATKPITTSTFIDQLLAPLPEGEETVKDKRFLREVQKDMEAVWHQRWLKVSSLQHYRQAASCARLYALSKGEDTDALLAKECEYDQLFLLAAHALMLTPAPRKSALKWKRNTRKFNGGRQEWEDAIAADEARLNGSLDADRLQRSAA